MGTGNRFHGRCASSLLEKVRSSFPLWHEPSLQNIGGVLLWKGAAAAVLAVVVVENTEGGVG